MKRKKSNALFVLLAAAISLLVLWAVQRLLVPSIWEWSWKGISQENIIRKYRTMMF